jgi:hypothetical protein
MELLGDTGQVEAHFGPFEAHPMVLLGEIGQVEACFGPFGFC